MGFKAMFGKKKKPDSASTSPDPAAPADHTPLRTPSTAGRWQISELEQVFRKFDVNGDGKISASEFGAIMKSLGQPSTEEEVKKMIGEVDADGDGFIDLSEFVELNTKGVNSDEVMENLRDAFSVYDIDGNGAITAEELHEVLKSLGDECSLAECRRMIGGVDADGDGTISFDEFKVMMMTGSRYDPLESTRSNTINATN